MTPAAKTANEQLLSAGIRHQIQLHQYGNKVVTDVLSLLNAADKELAAKLAVRLEAGKETWSSRRLQALIKEIATINAENYGAAAKLLKTEMVELAGVEAGVAATSTGKVLPALDVTEKQLTVALEKLSKIPFIQKGELEPIGFSEEFKQLADRAASSYSIKAGHELKRTIVPIEQLRTGQWHVEQSRVQGILENFKTATTKELAEDLPQVLGYKGELYILDGNHRVMAARLLDLKGIEVNYVNVTPENDILFSTPNPALSATNNVVFSVIQPTSEMLSAIVTTEAITLGPDGAELLDDIFKTLAAGKEARIRQAIRMGMAEGESIQDMVRRLIGSRAAQFTDGILEKDRRAAEAIVRTSVNHISNKAADMVYQQNTDLISGVQWCLTLDVRTCPVCVRNAQGGKPYKMDEGPRPPVHVNDRCFMIPVMKSWREMGLNIDEMPISGRASMDGVQAGDMTYGGWLRAYPDHAAEALGPARAKLFQEGKIKVEDFVNDRGRLLSLDELAQK